MTSFKVDPNAGDEVVRMPEVIQHFGDIADAAAQAVRAAWEASGPHPYETGDFVSSIHGISGTKNGRVAARVNADDYKAWWLEVGTEDTPAFAPLRLGADLIGLHLVGGQA